MFCLACSFQQKYSHASQGCKTWPRVLFRHSFYAVLATGTEACQTVGGKERHTEILHRMCRNHQGKHNAPHYLGRGNKHPAGCKVSSRALAMCSVLLWDLTAARQWPQGCCASFCSDRDLEQREQKLMWPIRRVQEVCQQDTESSDIPSPPQTLLSFSQLSFQYPQLLVDLPEQIHAYINLWIFTNLKNIA